jgi:hypothetical protein
MLFIAIPTSGANTPGPAQERRMGKAAPGNSGGFFHAGLTSTLPRLPFGNYNAEA